jgi:hypothetical protein
MANSMFFLVMDAKRIFLEKNWRMSPFIFLFTADLDATTDNLFSHPHRSPRRCQEFVKSNRPLVREAYLLVPGLPSIATPPPALEHRLGIGWPTTLQLPPCIPRRATCKSCSRLKDW